MVCVVLSRCAVTVAQFNGQSFGLSTKRQAAPRFESCTAVSNLGQDRSLYAASVHSTVLMCTWLQTMVDSGVRSLCALIAAWLHASQKIRNGVLLNKSARV